MRHPTQTRHLTDFVSARVPQISVCSASDMLSLTPADIWNKLRLLFYVLLSLFLAMNVGALTGFFIDTAERRSVLTRLRSARVGFAELPNGAWTWTCVQKSLTQDVQTPWPTRGAPAARGSAARSWRSRPSVQRCTG